MKPPILYAAHSSKSHVAGVCLVVLLAQAPAFAHHSLAMYNMTNPVTVKGVVTRLEWTNPHVHLFVNVQDGKGSVEEWAIEMDPPDFLMRERLDQHHRQAR